MIGIYIEYRPHPQHFETFLAKLKEDSAATLADAGCLRMEVALPEPPDGRVLLIELWRSEADIEAHRSRPGHSHAWQEPLVAEKRVTRGGVIYSPAPTWPGAPA